MGFLRRYPESPRKRKMGRLTNAVKQPIYGCTAQFGREAQREILCRFNVSKTGEYSVVFETAEMAQKIR